VYPDPVRVVSVGPEVGSLISEPASEEWASYSVEFCGGTHISNTREAGAFVILEETAVAKGIRRISAITGDYAVQAIQQAVSLDKEAAAIGVAVKAMKVKEGSDGELDALDDTVLSFRQRLEALSVSQVTKNRIRGQVEALQKEVSVLKNQAIVKKVDRVVTVAREEVRSLYAAGIRTAVLQVNVGSDAKAIKRVLEDIKKVCYNRGCSLNENYIIFFLYNCNCR